jgi:hypothetical protein
VWSHAAWYMAQAERAHKVEQAPGELVGITLGDRLGPADPRRDHQPRRTRAARRFAARYAATELMIYDSVGETEAGQGAIIACVYCSASMGHPHTGGITAEAWANACTLALLDQACKARRDFAGILFGSPGQIKMFRFPAGEPARIEDVADLSDHFLNGGTDFQDPLTAATKLLAAEYNTTGRATRRHRADHRRPVQGHRRVDGRLQHRQSRARLPHLRRGHRRRRPPDPAGRKRPAPSWTPCATTCAASTT